MIDERFIAPATPAGNDLWTIGDMARHYDLSLRALRFYEDRGLIKPLRHGTTRLYDADSRARLEKVLKAKRLGFTLGRIYDLLKKADAAEELERALDPSEVESQIAALEKQKVDLDQAITSLRAVHLRLCGAPEPLAMAG